MKFATIIRESGLSVNAFDKCLEIPITLYDGNDQEITDEDVHYAVDLFYYNTDSLEKFFHSIDKLEQSPVSHMNVRIDEVAVTLFYKSVDMISFPRVKDTK